MDFYASTIMSKESAQWICNSLYSVMMGFALSFTLFRGNSENNYSNILGLPVVIFIYYLFDWLSYNAILDYDPKQEHLQVLLTIFFILMLGWLLTKASHTEGTPISLYSLVSSIYVSASTILGTISLWIAYKEQKPQKLPNVKFWTFLRDFKLVTLDVIVRFLAVFVLLIIYASTTMALAWRQLLIQTVFSVILLSKHVRYQFLLCKLVREAKRADHRVKTKLIICPLIRKASMTRKEVKENLMYCPVANQLDKNEPEAKK